MLFFRYGITPTEQFWADMRDKTRVTIEHPDLLDAIKEVAADAVQFIWYAANEAATSELAALRAKAQLQASEAAAQRDLARGAVVVVAEQARGVLGRPARHRSVQFGLRAAPFGKAPLL